MSSAPPPEAGREAVLKVLQEATKDLLYMSESDFPLTPFFWTKEEANGEELTPERLLALVKQAAGTPVETLGLPSFLEPATSEEDWYGEEETKMAKGFQNLEKTLTAQLRDIKVFKVGKEAQKEVYIVGKTPTGDFAGVSTKVVET